MHEMHWVYSQAEGVSHLMSRAGAVGLQQVAQSEGAGSGVGTLTYMYM